MPSTRSICWIPASAPRRDRPGRRPTHCRCPFSARTGEGTDELLLRMDRLLSASRKTLDLEIALSDGATLAWLYRHGDVVSREDVDGFCPYESGFGCPCHRPLRTPNGLRGDSSSSVIPRSRVATSAFHRLTVNWRITIYAGTRKVRVLMRPARNGLYRNGQCCITEDVNEHQAAARPRARPSELKRMPSRRAVSSSRIPPRRSQWKAKCSRSARRRTG